MSCSVQIVQAIYDVLFMFHFWNFREGRQVLVAFFTSLPIPGTQKQYAFFGTDTVMCFVVKTLKILRRRLSLLRLSVCRLARPQLSRIVFELLPCFYHRSVHQSFLLWYASTFTSLQFTSLRMMPYDRCYRFVLWIVQATNLGKKLVSISLSWYAPSPYMYFIRLVLFSLLFIFENHNPRTMPQYRVLWICFVDCLNK